MSMGSLVPSRDWIGARTGSRFATSRDECLYVHTQQSDGSLISVVTITDVTPYEEVDGS